MNACPDHDLSGAGSPGMLSQNHSKDSRVFCGWADCLHGLLLAACVVAGEQEAVAQDGSPAANKPMAHWRFDEPAQSKTVPDAMGRYPGVLVGEGVSLGAAGIAGGAVSFSENATGRVTMGNVLPMMGMPYSFSVWCKTPAGDTTPEAVLLAKHTPWTENGYLLMLNGSGGAIAAYSSVGGLILSQKPINDGQWHHVAMTVQPGGAIQLYVDGGPPVATGNAGSVLANESDFMVGAIDPPPPARRFRGWIDEVQVYGKILAPDEVDYLHENPGLSLAEVGEILFRPSAGPVSNPTTVRLYTAISGGEIRYTLDGSDPLISSARYEGPFSIAVNVPIVVKARVFLNSFPVSEVRSVTYQKDPGIRFSPPAGRFTNQLDVAISSSLASVEVRYTTDGTEPRVDSPVFTTSLRLTQATLVRARAFLNGFPVTETLGADYRRVYVFDNDGIPAAWREKYFGPEFVTDPRAALSADPDQDRSTNLQEYISGTDPLDPVSGFGISVRAVPAVRFPSVVGQRYRILRRSSIESPGGIPIAEVTAASSETTYVDLEAGVAFNPAFYLVEAVR